MNITIKATLVSDVDAPGVPPGAFEFYGAAGHDAGVWESC